MGGRRDGEDSLDDFFDAFAEFRYVQHLESAFGMADEIYFRRAGSGLHGLDEVCDLIRGGCDGFEAADEEEGVIFSVCGAKGAVVLGLQVEFEDVDVFVVGCAEAVEEDDGVWVGFAFAVEVVVHGDSFGDWS